MATVSVIMATFDRSHTIARAIRSVLRQDFADWELIVVDDGSRDCTREVVSRHSDTRIQLIGHTQNRGVAFARNRGLDAMTGEWFTLLDSDDEMVPTALSTMLELADRLDDRVDAITCNCLDSTTGEFTGYGLDHDQWLDFETMVRCCSGEHWGLTKTSLLGAERFNEALPWGEAVLWYRIAQHARRYYLHRGLRIYHREGDDRLCAAARRIHLGARIVYYNELSKEAAYLNTLRLYRPRDYAAITFRMAIARILNGDVRAAKQLQEQGAPSWGTKYRFIWRIALRLGPRTLWRILSVLGSYQ